MEEADARLVPHAMHAVKHGISRLCFVFVIRAACLTGRDYTNKIGTKHAALMTNPKHNLKDFVTYTDKSTIDKAEEYIIQVLKKRTKFKKMDQLRNELYHHSKSVSLQQLPPTSSATTLPVHILRAVYATNEMASLLSTTHDRLDPTQFWGGWRPPSTKDGRQTYTWRLCYPQQLSEMWDTKLYMP